MKEVISYDSLCEQIAKLQKEKELQDTLHELRVPRNTTPFFSEMTAHIKSHVTSGYSMGEYISFWFNDIKLIEYDDTKEYAKSCTWNAKHGNVRFVFDTKKRLRDFCDLLKLWYYNFGDKDIREKVKGTLSSVLCEKKSTLKPYFKETILL